MFIDKQNFTELLVKNDKYHTWCLHAKNITVFQSTESNVVYSNKSYKACLSSVFPFI